MLQVSFIRENREMLAARLAIKNFDADDILDRILRVDEKRRQAKQNLDQNLAEANRIAREIGQLFKEGKKEEAGEKRRRSGELKQIAKALSGELDEHNRELRELLVQVPNVPHPSVPPGNSEADNEIVHEEGRPP